MLINIIQTIAESGRDVIVDGPNLSTRFPNQVRDRLGDRHQYAIQDFTGVSLEFCINNDRHRSSKNPWAYAGSQEVAKAWHAGQALCRRLGGAGLSLGDEKLNRSDGIGPYVPDPNLPRAVIVDIDAPVGPARGRASHDATPCWRHDVADLVQQLAHGDG